MDLESLAYNFLLYRLDDMPCYVQLGEDGDGAPYEASFY
jgi:hypothetical protein